MFTNKTWITNGVKKVKNPAQIPDVNNIYQGVLDEFVDFKFQTENYKKIKELLEPHNIFMTEIYSARRENKTIFVVMFNNGDFMWQKYEGKAVGSGQNYVYYKAHRINTTIFTDLSPEELVELFNGCDPQVFIQRRANI
jgi:hypothetical protein